MHRNEDPTQPYNKLKKKKFKNILSAGQKFPPVETFDSGLHYSSPYTVIHRSLYHSKQGLVLGSRKLILLEVGRGQIFENFPILPRADQLAGHKEKLWVRPSRWWRSKMWRSSSSPQIYQKCIYMWNNSYRTPPERWQKTSDS